jgi:hypothetical protein
MYTELRGKVIVKWELFLIVGYLYTPDVSQLGCTSDLYGYYNINGEWAFSGGGIRQ